MRYCGYIWLLLLWTLTYSVYTAFGQCTAITAYSSIQYITSHTLYSSTSTYSYYKYSSSTDRCWVITTSSSNKIVKLHRTSAFPFELESFSTSSCIFDRLEAYNSNTNTGFGQSVNFCGYNIFSTLYSSGRYMYLRFKSDSTNQYRGFKLAVSETDSSYYSSYRWSSSSYVYGTSSTTTSSGSTGSCTSITATSTVQHIQSHSFYGISDYTSSLSKCWVITTSDSSKVVKVERVGTFKTESSSACSYDYLKAYNSLTASGTYVKYCGTNSLTTLYSSGRYMYLKFVTDSSSNYDGFKLAISEASSFYYSSSQWQTTYNTGSDSSSIGLTVGAIIGIIVGVIVGIIVLVVIGVIVCVSMAAGTKNGRRVGVVRGNHMTVVTSQQQQAAPQPVGVQPYTVGMQPNNGGGQMPPVQNPPIGHQYPPPPPAAQYPPPPAQYPPPPPAYGMGPPPAYGVQPAGGPGFSNSNYPPS